MAGSDAAPDEVMAGTQREDIRLARHKPVAAGRTSRELAELSDDLVLQVKQFLGSLRKRWKLASTLILAALLLGVIYTLSAVPIYQATSSLKIENQGTNVLNFQGVNYPYWGDEELLINTEIQLITSREMALRVVKRLNLTSNSAFFEKMHMHGLAGPNASREIRQARETAAAGTLQGNLSVRPIRDTRIIQISFQSPDPTLSAEIANAYAKAAIEADADRGLGTSKFAREFLENRLAQTRAKLEASEQSVIDYARKEGLVDTSGAAEQTSDSGNQVTGPSLPVSDLVAINSAYINARAKRIVAQAQWREASTSNSMVQPDLLSNPTIQALSAARAEASAQYQSLLKTLKPNYPEMIQLNAKIQALDQSIAEEATKFRASLKARYQAAMREEQALGQEVRQLKGASLDNEERNVKLGILKREVDTNRSFYNALLERYKQISAASGSYLNAITLVDEAQTPGGPVRPVPSRNILVAFVLGAVAAFIAVFVLEQLDDSVRVPNEIQEKLGLPLIGVIPKHGKKIDPKADLYDPASQLAEAYMSVSTSLKFASSMGTPSPLLITSARASEGKSTTALALAIAYVRTARRVLIIDGDLRKPSLHKLLELDNKSGFSEVLTSQKELGQVVNPFFDDFLHVVTSGPRPPDPAGLLAGLLLKKELHQARSFYDVIIVDGPPVLGLADAPLIATACHATLLVIEAAGTKPLQCRSAIERLNDSGTPIIGAVLTKFDYRTDGYGSGYGYNYHYRYGHQA